MTHEILLEGDSRLFNQYGVVTINPARCPTVKSAAADKFVDWLLSTEGQTSIGALTRDSQPCFSPTLSNRWLIGSTKITAELFAHFLGNAQKPRDDS